MNSADFVKLLEENYDVASVRVGKLQVWPFLRMHYCNSWNSKHLTDKDRSRDNKFSIAIRKIRNVFNQRTSFHSFLIRKHDYVLFTDPLGLRIINNSRWVDIIAEGVLSCLGRERFLVFQLPVEEISLDKKWLRSSYKDMLSTDCIFLVAALMRRLSLTRNKIPIEKEDVLKVINFDWNLEVNYNRIISSFMTYVRLLKRLFHIVSPKAIFVNCYYDLVHQAAIYAAKEMGIKVIELQHGIIVKAHPAYNIFTHLEDRFFPDYLLAFGEYVRDEQSYIANKRVLCVGSYYIDYLSRCYSLPIDKLLLSKQLRSKYKRIVAVSSQDTIQVELLSFLKEAAQLDESIFYLFIPRKAGGFKYTDLPANIKVGKGINLDIDVYEALILSDIHVTVYSTCAIEAPALGVPNILVNINNLAIEYYSDLLKDDLVGKVVDTPKELVCSINTWRFVDREAIRSRQKFFPTDRHEQLLRRALEVMLQP